MDLRSGIPLWLVRDGLPYAYPKLSKNVKTDVLIVGGGISGALMAHYLMKNNISCIVTDARTIGLGSTCASTSLLQYQIDVPLCDLAEQIGEQGAARAYRLCAYAVDELERLSKELNFKFFERKKTLFYASKPKHEQLIKKEYELHRKHRFKVEYWNEKLIGNRLGFSSPAALYSDHSAQTDAYLLTHALLQHNVEKGLEVFDRTKITQFRHSKKSVRAISEEGFHVDAKKVIYATGYEAVNYVPKKIVNLSATYAIASEQLNETTQWFENCLIWETRQPYLYCRTTADKRIIVGGRDEDYYNPTRRDRQVKTKSRLLTRDFGKLFPHVALNTEFSWAGTFGTTKDGLPYIGECPGVANGLFALGFGGNGITFSLIAAEMISDHLMGRKNRDSNLFSFNR